MRAIFSYLGRGGGEETNGWPACLAFVCAKKWEKCLHSLVCLCVWAPPPLRLSSSSHSLPAAWDGNYFHETKVAAIILPDPIPEGQEQQLLLLLHANGTIHYGNGARCPCEVHVEELIFFFSSCRQIDKINQIHSKIIMKQTVTAMNRDWRVGENFAKLKLGRI